MPPKMTMAWVATYWGLLAMSLAKGPAYGVLGYIFEYYLRPSLHWWGDPLPRLRYSLIASLVVVVSYFIHKTNLEELTPTKNPAVKYLVMLATLMIIISPFGIDVVESWDTTLYFWKFVALYAFLIACVRSEWALNAFIWMHVAGAAWWGWEAYQDPSRSASRLLNVGSGDTLNDNQAAGHLLTVLPFALLLVFSAKNKIAKGFAGICTLLIINVFILCNSRGATVGLVVALVFAMALARKGHRIRMVGAAVGVACLFLWLADPEFIQRQQTTLNYEQESTAQIRLSNWDSALRMARDYPFGAGGNGYNELSPIYAPGITSHRSTGKISPHNTWILLLAEWGIPGLLVFLLFIGSTFRLLHRIRKDNKDGLLYYRSLAIQIGLIGTLAAATFSDRLYGESIYWLCAMGVIDYRLHMHARATAPTASMVPATISATAPAGALPQTVAVGRSA